MKSLLILLLTWPLPASAIPKHSHPVDRLWGWECDKGYIQHRDKCIKVKVPRKATLNEDGHTWSCREGYEKYRDVCVKIKK